jgi:histidinol-phosphatase (PHP family)
MREKMIVDLHNHTPLCNHAQGSIDEYIEKAIQAKTLYFGFSDHAPMNFDPKYRMKFSDMQDYERNVKNAREKYKEKITILLGYEVDYLKGHMDERVLNADVDYLIGSVHFLDAWGFDNPEFIGRWETQDIDEIWQKYFSLIEDMANEKLFEIVGHIDLIKVFQFYPKKKTVLEYATPALEAIKKADMILELNVAGYRKPCQEPYPSKEILQKAYALEIPITFGSDAHSPDQVSLFSQEIQTLAKEVGYTQCVYYKNKKRHFVDF